MAAYIREALLSFFTHYTKIKKTRQKKLCTKYKSGIPKCGTVIANNLFCIWEAAA